MKGQFEQHCNAAALKEMGVPVTKSLRMKHLDNIKLWLQSGSIVSVNYPDNTEQVVSNLVSLHAFNKRKPEIRPGRKAFSVKKFRELSLKKFLYN